jgi:hypothetical protein
MVGDREWELLSYAVSEIAAARDISEAEAFEHLKAWVVDGKVKARGPWPDGPGTASLGEPVSIPAHEFRFVHRGGGEKLHFLESVKASPRVEFKIKEVRAILDGDASEAAPDDAGQKNVGGRPGKADWSALKEALKNEVKAVGLPNKDGVPGWRTIADVATWLGARLADDEDVSPRTLRDQARRMLSEIKDEIGRN